MGAVDAAASGIDARVAGGRWVTWRTDVRYAPAVVQAAVQATGQGTLFSAGEEVLLRPLGVGSERTTLGRGAWVELRPGWVGGAGPLFDRLMEKVPWREERRRMYDRLVDVPRLQHFYEQGASLPDPSLGEMRTALDRRYAEEVGEAFRTVGLCLYRNGHDSVAWHGDTIGRAAREDTVVAIVSFGSARRFLLRPRGGGAALRFVLAAGDLLVMGGSCQRTWEHAVPKSIRPLGPRLSVQFRPNGVR